MTTRNVSKFLILTLITIFSVLLFYNKNFVEASSSEPIMYWDFNNQGEIYSGLVSDKQNLYNGKIETGIWTPSGYSGGAMIFDSSNSQLPVTTPWVFVSLDGVTGGPTGITQFTLTLMARFENSKNANQGSYIAEAGHFNVNIKNDILGIGIPGNVIQKQINIDNNWHYLAITNDGQNVTLYYDGVLIETRKAIEAFIVDGPWNFGSIHYSIHPENDIFNPLYLDEIRFYNYVLSQEEISYEYTHNKVCSDIWICEQWLNCDYNGIQSRNCTKTFDCPSTENTPPAITQSCTPPPCTNDIWSCGEWNSCLIIGIQSRNCTKTFDCPSTEDISPVTTQSCIYNSICNGDTWECGNWGTCSPSGIQTRNCNKILDCPSVETAAPAISQYCLAPSNPFLQTPAGELGKVNQDNNSTADNKSGSGQTNSITGLINNTYDLKLQNRLKGYILLQVESNGEAWYVNPVDGKRYYMKDGVTAYQMMRNLSLGITNTNLAKIPQEREKNSYPLFVNKQKGKILLQVEERGEAWYVNPKTGYRYYMADGDAAYNLMRYHGLGISNKDLEKIPEGNL